MRTSVGGAQLLPQRAQGLLVVGGQVDAHPPTRRREEERIAHRHEQVLGETAGLVPGVEELTERDEGAGDVLVGHRPEHRQATGERGAPEQRVHLLDVDPAVRDGLVEQRQRVTHRARARPGDDGERLTVGLDALPLAHVGQVTDDLVDGVERELVVLGAGTDGGRDLERVGRGEHEDHVLGGLLERLQQCGLRPVLSMWTSSRM